MMEALCYTAVDLAAVIVALDLGIRTAAAFLERVWAEERQFLAPMYRDDKGRMLRDVDYWRSYLCHKPAIDAEFPALQRDAAALGRELSPENYLEDYFDLNLFFKSARLRILYVDGQDYVRIKRRSLMARYGYKRLSPALAEHFRCCTYYYHLQPYVRGGCPCRIEDVGMDEMIIFRVI